MSWYCINLKIGDWNCQEVKGRRNKSTRRKTLTKSPENAIHWGLTVQALIKTNFCNRHTLTGFLLQKQMHKRFHHFYFCIPHLYPWGSPFLVRFCVCEFLNPTIEVVTFHLHGWCMLGVFLLPAFIRLGHEYQDLLSLCDGMHVCTD